MTEPSGEGRVEEINKDESLWKVLFGDGHAVNEVNLRREQIRFLIERIACLLQANATYVNERNEALSKLLSLSNREKRLRETLETIANRKLANGCGFATLCGRIEVLAQEALEARGGE